MDPIKNKSATLLYNDLGASKKAIEHIFDKHAHKLTLGDKKALEVLDWQSLVHLSLVDKSFERLRKLVSYRKPEIETYIDLRLFTNIQRCLASSFKEDFFVNKAMELARQFYETKPRKTSEPKYGFSYPMAPELLYYAMFLARGEIVVEIGGADGKHAGLIAFSGAKQVFMNDIVPTEVESFKNLCQQFPTEVQKKIEPVLGNCFELLQLKPELEGKVGLLLCNNLLHFFMNNEQESFLSLLKKILRPGGRAIFTANACFGCNNSEIQQAFEDDPEHTYYGNIGCYFYEHPNSGYPIKALFQSILPIEQKNEIADYFYYYLAKKNETTHYKWVEDKSGYDSLPKREADELKTIVAATLQDAKKLKDSSLKLTFKEVRYFREESFAALFKKAGFEVEQTFLIKADGHLFFGKNPYEGANKVGIVIKAPIV